MSTQDSLGLQRFANSDPQGDERTIHTLRAQLAEAQAVLREVDEKNSGKCFLCEHFGIDADPHAHDCRLAKIIGK